MRRCDAISSKAPFLACSVLNLMDLYNFSGKNDFTLLLVFQGNLTPKMPLNFLIGELSKFNYIDHIPYGGLAPGKILHIEASLMPENSRLIVIQHVN